MTCIHHERARGRLVFNGTLHPPPPRRRAHTFHSTSCSTALAHLHEPTPLKQFSLACVACLQIAAAMVSIKEQLEMLHGVDLLNGQTVDEVFARVSG
jgi:hypothetical protein